MKNIVMTTVAAILIPAIGCFPLAYAAHNNTLPTNTLDTIAHLSPQLAINTDALRIPIKKALQQQPTGGNSRKIITATQKYLNQLSNNNLAQRIATAHFDESGVMDLPEEFNGLPMEAILEAAGIALGFQDTDVIANAYNAAIKLAVSGRHAHPSGNLIVPLNLTKEMNDQRNWQKLRQPGQYAVVRPDKIKYAQLVGRNGNTLPVNFLLPARSQTKTQVEITGPEAIVLGFEKNEVPVRTSGHLTGAPTISIQRLYPDGSIGPVIESSDDSTIQVIHADRHIHLPDWFASQLGLRTGDVVLVLVEVPQPDGNAKRYLLTMTVRVSPEYGHEGHLDTEEAVRLGIRPGQHATLYMLFNPQGDRRLLPIPGSAPEAEATPDIQRTLFDASQASLLTKMLEQSFITQELKSRLQAYTLLTYMKSYGAGAEHFAYIETMIPQLVNHSVPISDLAEQMIQIILPYGMEYTMRYLQSLHETLLTTFNKKFHCCPVVVNIN